MYPDIQCLIKALPNILEKTKRGIERKHTTIVTRAKVVKTLRKQASFILGKDFRGWDIDCMGRNF